MAEIIVDGLRYGTAQIGDDVIGAIAGAAAMEVDGVAGLSARFTGDLAEALGMKAPSKKVKIEVDGKDVIVDVSLALKFGVKIQETSEQVQRRVKTSVETMTGLNVKYVNVAVVGVVPVRAARLNRAKTGETPARKAGRPKNKTTDGTRRTAKSVTNDAATVHEPQA